MSDPKALDEFKQIARGYYAVYVTANEGMSILAKNRSSEDSYHPNEMYKVTDASTGEVICKMPNYRMINGMSFSGPFSQIVAHGILNWIYAIWETRYRKKIAEELDQKHQDNVVSNVMGDLRVIRHFIAHDFAFSDDSLHKLKVFTWIPKGPLILHLEDMNRIQMAINNMNVSIKPTNSDRA